MKKTLSFALLAAFGMGSLALADISLGSNAATPAAPAETTAPAAGTASAEVYMEQLQEMMSTLDEMLNLLSTVKDKATADEAATAIGDVKEKMVALQRAGEALGTPSPDIIAKLEPMRPELEARFGKLMEVMMPLIMNNFYGSDALKQVLGAME